MAKGNSGTGLGLGLGAGTVSVNTCSSQDKTWFCQASRIFQVISWVFSIFIFMVVVYIFFEMFVLSKFKKRSKGFF